MTGGTGYVGAFLCRALAERDDVSEVIAVVRAADDDKASTRLRGNCEGDWGSLVSGTPKSEPSRASSTRKTSASRRIWSRP